MTIHEGMPEQNKLEKVIEGLWRCELIHRGAVLEESCNVCPYQRKPGETCEASELFHDARKLLKAQEPRVMTLEELHELAIIKLANNDEIVWAEDNGSDDCCDGYCSPDLGYPNDSIIILWEPGNDCSYMPNMADYGVRWRCWTSRPDEKRRAETPWN